MAGAVVVVGGGIGGVSTVAALRSGGFDGDVTLVDAGEFPYDRPPLSKEYLAGNSEIKDIALQPPQWYDEHDIRLITKSCVTALRTGSAAVELADGSTLFADWVVLSTGGNAARPPIPGADTPRVHALRTADDADRLRAALIPGARVLIVGAGLIGAEVASTARSLGCEVVLTDPLERPLSTALGTMSPLGCTVCTASMASPRCPTPWHRSGILAAVSMRTCRVMKAGTTSMPRCWPSVWHPRQP